MYAYFKQATQNPAFASADIPGMFDLKVRTLPSTSTSTSTPTSIPVIHHLLSQPKSLNDHQGKYKYKAWEKVAVEEGVTPADAEKKYIALVEAMKQKHGYDPSKKPEEVGAS